MRNNEALSEIYLENNLIQDIKTCFRNLTNVKILFLNGNQLSDLKSVCEELNYLKAIEKLSNLIEKSCILVKILQHDNYRNIFLHD